jgi:ABC-type cobalamin/Fe3+-siderophores transport system ATPase subunit
MTFAFSIPTAVGPFGVSLEPGSTVVIVGANGTGKTRLAVLIERTFAMGAHRIGAQRALVLNPNIAKIGEQPALMGLRFGYAGADAQIGYRDQHRWGAKGATFPLNDFDFLLQALFGDQSNIALQTHAAARSGTLLGNGESTKFERLKNILERLLPHRRLILSGDTIRVSAPDVDPYSASDMSDGERSVFYMVGQALVVAPGSLLIVDEPELHIHPSIMSKLWDEIEAARPDCGFVFITHDLAFAAQRVGQKFVIRDYNHGPQWALEAVPDDTGFDEEIVTLILGSRKPVLFVEGNGMSLDTAMFRAVFPHWTVIHRGSCEEVLHSVVTMRRNASLTRVTCAGLIDGDDYTPQEREAFAEQGVAVLPVSEIENLILLPSVSSAIASSEGYVGEELVARLDRLKQAVFAAARSQRVIGPIVVRYCRRRIDRMLKGIDLGSAETPEAIAAEYASKTAALDINALAATAHARIATAVANNDLVALLQCFDNKGALLAAAASHLKSTRKDQFEDWLLRTLRNGSVCELTNALRSEMPQIESR